MGIWDYISSTANAVNQNALIPARNLCWTSYSYGRAAASRIGNAITATAVPKLSHRFQDQDTRSQMGQFATNCAKNASVVALREGLKTVPGGGPIFEIVSRSVPRNQKSEKHINGELRTLKSGLEDQGGEIKKLHDLLGKMGKEIISLKELNLNQIEVHEQDRDVGLREEISSLKQDRDVELGRETSSLKEVLDQIEGDELDRDVEWESTIREVSKNQTAAIRFFMTKNLYSNANKQPMNAIQNMIAKGFLSHYNFNDLDMTKKCHKSC